MITKVDSFVSTMYTILCRIYLAPKISKGFTLWSLFWNVPMCGVYLVDLTWSWVGLISNQNLHHLILAVDVLAEEHYFVVLCYYLWKHLAYFVSNFHLKQYFPPNIQPLWFKWSAYCSTFTFIVQFFLGWRERLWGIFFMYQNCHKNQHEIGQLYIGHKKNPKLLAMEMR